MPPLEQESDDTSRELTLNGTVRYSDGSFPPGIPGMEVRRIMIAVVDRNDDSEEPADLWH